MSTCLLFIYALLSIYAPTYANRHIQNHDRLTLAVNINALCVMIIAGLMSLFGISQWVNTHVHNDILWIIAIGFTWVSFFLLIDMLLTGRHDQHFISDQLKNHPFIHAVLTVIGLSYIGLIVLSIVGM